MPLPPKTREPSLLVLGATGFTGRLAVAYLAHKYPTTTVVAAARSTSKLQALQQEVELPPKHTTAVCDLADRQRLDQLVADADVVLNYAGTPFIDKALPVVEACARHGVHYVDICGEVPLQRASFDRFDEQARASGAIILHQCGYDSVPADISSLLAVKTLRECFGSEAAELRIFAGKASGGVSGGTLETAIRLATDSEYPGKKEFRADGLYVLAPGGRPRDAPFFDGMRMFGYDRLAKTWFMPSVMAAVNTPVVLKSAAHLNYGGNCRVSEVQALPNFVVAALGSALLATALALIALPPTRWLMFATGLLPRPGSGPSRESRERGHFHTYTIAVGPEEAPGVAPRLAVGHVRSGSAGDPGYKATAQMSAECALCLALEPEECASSVGGVLTPASALGSALVSRLRRSGMQLDGVAL